jgi:tight adherence protein B
MELIWENRDLAYLMYTGIALGVLLLFTGISQLLTRGENRAEAKSRRLKMMAKGRTTAEILAVLKPEEKGGPLSRVPFFGTLSKDMRKAGMLMSPGQFLLICAFLVVIATTVSSQFLAVWQSLIVGPLVGLFLPVVFVKQKRNQRSDALIKQLPDALDLLARGLRVGHPLNTSIGAVAEEMADPIGTEFGLIFDQVSYGDDLADAVAEFSERVDLEDVYYLSASVGIQHGTGGDLARVISVLGQVVRSRIAMRRRIQAISAEGRMTAWFLSALPVLIYLSTSVTSPSYYAGVADDPLFVPMASAIVGLTVLNFLVLRKLVNFRI